MSRIRFDEEHIEGKMLSEPLDENTRREVIRRATAAYAIALGLIALLAAGLHLLMSEIVAKQADSAVTINVAGRQRMLSQRIALLGEQYIVKGDESARVLLETSVALFARSDAALQQANGAFGIVNPPSRAVVEIFSGPAGLRSMIAQYLEDAERVLDRSASAEQRSAALERVLAAANAPLLEQLDRVVAQYTRESAAQIELLQFWTRALFAVLLVTLAAEALLIFRPLISRITRYLGLLSTLASTDTLTTLFNRRQFLSLAGRDAKLAARTGRHMAMLMVDIDHFKRINDTYSHAAGDAVLRSVAATLKRAVRTTDIVARMGGEEIAILLPDTDGIGALVLAERVRAAIEETGVLFEGQSISLTASIGSASARGRAVDVDALLKRADDAMYAAKKGGRNRAMAG